MKCLKYWDFDSIVVSSSGELDVDKVQGLDDRSYWISCSQDNFASRTSAVNLLLPTLD